MSATLKCQRITALGQTLTIMLFLALLWLPTADYFLKLDHSRKMDEHRLSAAWPQFTGLGQTRDFVAGLESYFNDHFGFRQRLIHTSRHWKQQLFHDPAAEKDVLIGRDGWLFYSGEAMIPHFLREETWNEQELAEWRRLLEQRRDWLRARGIKYLFVVAPNKESVYPEYLPDWLRASAQPSKIQLLVNYMKAHSTVPVLDLGSSLIAAKKVRADYLKTDTHWNDFGGFAGYREVMETLAQQRPGLAPVPLALVDWQFTPGPGGDLARMLGLAELYPESNAVVMVAPKGSLARLTFDPLQSSANSALELPRIHTFNPNASGKAVIFRDSFAQSWLGLLGQHFRDVVYIWQFQWDHALIEREKPDVVVDEMLERNFNVADPKELAQDKPLSNKE